MLDLKREIELSIEAINADIAETQKEIDDLFYKSLENPVEDYRVKISSLTEKKFHHYGWKGSLEFVLQKINIKLEIEQQEFEEMLESVPTSI